MNLSALAGVFAPITTPFSDDRVDAAALRANVRRYMASRLAGLVVLGTSGEAPLLEDAEADAAIAAAKDGMLPGRLLVAGAGRESTSATIAAVRRAASLGADAVLVRTPSSYKGQLSTDAFVRHYQAVAEASTLPVVLYNYSAFTGVTLPPEAVARLATHPNIAGIKESGSDASHLSGYIASASAHFHVLVGSAQAFYAGLCLGAAGGILALACVVPDECVRLFELTAGGNHGEALALQRRLLPLAKTVTTRYGIAGLKAAVSLAGYVGGPPRGPYAALDDVAVGVLRGELSALESRVG